MIYLMVDLQLYTCKFIFEVLMVCSCNQCIASGSTMASMAMVISEFFKGSVIR